MWQDSSLYLTIIYVGLIFWTVDASPYAMVPYYLYLYCLFCTVTFSSTWICGCIIIIIFYNSIIGVGGIWTLDVSVKNTKRCQLSYKALGWYFSCILVVSYLYTRLFICCLQVSGTMEASQSPPPPSGGHFAIGQDQLAVMSRDHDVSALQQFGGASLQLNYLFILFYYIWFLYC